MEFHNKKSKANISDLRIIRTKNIGSQAYFYLKNTYGDCALKKLFEIKQKNNLISDIYTQSQAENEIEKIHKYNASLIYHDDPLYPHHLKFIADKPVFIIAKGNLENINTKKIICMVGSRDASIVGENFAYKISRELSDMGYHIISGMAIGIDAASHKGNINQGTIAVMAAGIDTVYPKTNSGLFDKIQENGIIISEMPFGTPLSFKLFHKRNRIIAGSSEFVIVIESQKKSGTMVTARFGIDYGKDILVVPGHPLDGRYSGNNHLIKNGATLIEGVEDIKNHINNDFTKICSKSAENEIKLKKEPKIDSSIKKTIKDAIGVCPTNIDDIAIRTRIKIDDIIANIIEMEIEGDIIKQNNTVISCQKKC